MGEVGSIMNHLIEDMKSTTNTEIEIFKELKEGGDPIKFAEEQMEKYGHSTDPEERTKFAKYWKYVEMKKGKMPVVVKRKTQMTRKDASNKLLKDIGIKNPEQIFSPKGQAEFYMGIKPLYYDRSKIWWIWNDSEKKWQTTDETDILNEVSDKTGQDVITPKNRTMILNALQQEARRNKPQSIEPTWIQFKDEIVDIKNGETFIATPYYFVTNPIPHKMNNPDCETPNMDRIFKEWVGEKNVQILYEILAYCTLPNYPIHRVFCFLGAGLNGKGAFLRLIAKFIGLENCCSTELDRLMSSRFELASLHNKLVCLMGETDFNEMKQTGRIKSLTGQDLVNLEYKGKAPFPFTNYAKIIIATNNLPSTVDKTIGWYRRWCIVDFPNQFTEAKDILEDIPETEYQSLARKTPSILKELLKKKCFHNEGSIQERMEKYEERSNPFDKFWQDNIKEDFEGHISKRQFQDKLNEWCKENRFRKLSDRTIAKYMKDKEVESKRFQMEWAQVKEGESKPRYWGWGGINWKN